MLIIGCDYHPGMQQIAWLEEQNGEYGEQALEHSSGEAERFYRELKRRGVQVRVGIEASGHTRWFERLLAELEMEMWIGNPAKIAAQRVRKQKNDREDARLLLRLLREGRFPQLWVPSPENRDLAATAVASASIGADADAGQESTARHRHQRGVQRKSGLWSKTGRRQLESFALCPWTARRGHDLLALLDQLTPQIAELSQAVEQEASSGRRCSA
jgi:transposase